MCFDFVLDTSTNPQRNSVDVKARVALYSNRITVSTACPQCSRGGLETITGQPSYNNLTLSSSGFLKVIPLNSKISHADTIMSAPRWRILMYFATIEADPTHESKILALGASVAWQTLHIIYSVVLNRLRVPQMPHNWTVDTQQIFWYLWNLIFVLQYSIQLPNSVQFVIRLSEPPLHTSGKRAKLRLL